MAIMSGRREKTPSELRPDLGETYPLNQIKKNKIEEEIKKGRRKRGMKDIRGAPKEGELLDNGEKKIRKWGKTRFT